MGQDTKLRESITIRLRPQDVERLETIRKKLGIRSHTEVIRYALAQAASAAPVGRRELPRRQGQDTAAEDFAEIERKAAAELAAGGS